MQSRIGPYLKERRVKLRYSWQCVFSFLAPRATSQLPVYVWWRKYCEKRRKKNRRQNQYSDQCDLGTKWSWCTVGNVRKSFWNINFCFAHKAISTALLWQLISNISDCASWWFLLIVQLWGKRLEGYLMRSGLYTNAQYLTDGKKVCQLNITGWVGGGGVA